MSTKISLKQLKESFEKYKLQNEEFIILHSGLSKYRLLRTFLINIKINQTPLIYDIIIVKKPKETTTSKKKTAILKLKADLGVLDDNEITDISKSFEIHVDFLNNPFFYTDTTELIADLNFKNYMQVKFNIALFADGSPVKEFSEINEGINEIFLCSINENQIEQDRISILKSINKIIDDMKYPESFYSIYKNVLDIQSVPFHLENFTETTEFMPKPETFTYPHNSKVSPLKVRPERDEENSLTEPQPKLIKFTTSLNKSPLRKRSPSNIGPILPLLPQRYVILKKDFKDSNLRHVFLVIV